MAMSVRC
jgi:hypothetical protein